MDDTNKGNGEGKTMAICAFCNGQPINCPLGRSKGAYALACRLDEAFTLISATPALLEMSGLGHWDGNGEGNPLYQKLLPEGREAWDKAFGSGKKEFHFEAYLMSYKDITLALRFYGEINEDASGMPFAVLMIHDLTEERWGQELLRQQKNHNDIVVSLSNQILFEYNLARGRIRLEAQPISAGERCFVCRFPNNELTEEQVQHEDRAIFRHFCCQMRAGQKICKAELRLILGEENRWVNVLAKAVCDSKGNAIKYVGRLLDVNEQKLEKEKLLYQAQRDPLTQLYNQNMIRKMVENQLHGTDLQPGVLLILDIDNFKRVNDQFGHYFGDFVIRGVADQLRAVDLPGCVAGRIGGDEFMLLLPGVTQEQAENTARDILQGIIRIFQDDGGTHGVSCSIGIAEYPDCGQTYAEVFQKADAALYAAKLAGKNRYCFYNQENGTDLKSDQGYFNTYQMEERCPPMAKGGEETDWGEMILSMLNRTTKLDQVIPLVLRVLGTQLEVDKISVMEFITEEQAALCAYQWSVSGDCPDEGSYVQYGQDVIEALINEYEETPLIQVENIEEADTSDICIYYAKKKGATAFVYYATFAAGIVQYCFQFEHYGERRHWTKQEVQFIREVSDILSTHLLRYRAKNEVNALVNTYVNYDFLTKLPTLAKFRQDAEKLRKERPGQIYAVAYMDFKNFKYLNDNFGYVTGDKVLCDYSNLLKAVRMPDELVCRISNDNFACLLSSCDMDALIERLDGINAYFHDLLLEQYSGVNMMINTGLYPIRPEDSISAAIDNANTARKLAKKQGMNTCILFDDTLRQRTELEAVMFGSLERALADREFVIYYQPQYSLADRSIVGMEALVRWKRADGSLISPAEFIPFFESNGMITKIDFYVLEEACDAVRRWLDSGLPVVPVSVNLSREDCKRKDIFQRLLWVIDSRQIPHYLIEFELTETVFVDNIDFLQTILQNLVDSGFEVAIDDFGSGYSSLTILSKVPATILKLDKEFLNSGGWNDRNKLILESVVAMSKQVGMKVICEGVEFEEQAAFCSEIGCDIAQGFLFSKPVSEEEITKMLK